MSEKCDERWKRKGCAFWVSMRQYSDPGPCENRRDVRPVHHDGKFVPACAPHRAMVERGQTMQLTKAVLEEGRRQLRLIKRFKRALAAR